MTIRTAIGQLPIAFPENETTWLNMCFAWMMIQLILAEGKGQSCDRPTALPTTLKIGDKVFDERIAKKKGKLIIVGPRGAIFIFRRHLRRWWCPWSSQWYFEMCNFQMNSEYDALIYVWLYAPLLSVTIRLATEFSVKYQDRPFEKEVKLLSIDDLKALAGKIMKGERESAGKEDKTSLDST